jgi:hypothetical protein
LSTEEDTKVVEVLHTTDKLHSDASEVGTIETTTGEVGRVGMEDDYVNFVSTDTVSTSPDEIMEEVVVEKEKEPVVGEVS